MAEINNQNNVPSGGKVRSKKLSTKIDMTPMVDLAFLLLTFFILTTTFIKENALQVDMPDRSGPTSPVNDKNVLTLILGERDAIYWWNGSEGPVNKTDYSHRGLRRVLLERKRTNPKVMVLIKPSDDSRYNNLVDALDEMVIAGIERYAVMDYLDQDDSQVRTLSLNTK